MAILIWIILTLFALLSGGPFWSALADAPTQQSQPQAVSAEHCFRQWALVFDEGQKTWQSHDMDVFESAIDLRSRPQVESAFPSGYGFFTYSGAVVQGAETVGCYGPDPGVGLSDNQVVDIEAAFGVSLTLDSPTLINVVWELVTTHSDPLAASAVRSLIPDVNRNLNLTLPGTEITMGVKFNIASDPHRFKVLALHQAEYRGLVELEAAGDVGKDAHRKTLTVWMEKYGTDDWEQFVPSDLPKLPPLPHDTTLNESWDCGDSDSITCDLTWVEDRGDTDIVSNVAETGSGTGVQQARTTSTLSSGDHYAQADATFVGTAGGARETGVTTRIESGGSNDSYYYSFLRFDSDQVRTQRFDNNTPTTLQTTSFTLNESTVYELKLESDGSTHKLFVDSSQIGPNITDSTYTTNTIVGIHARTGNAADLARWDNWEAADLAAAARRRAIIISQRR